MLNHELVVAGGANLAAGLVGGLIGFHSISMSTINYALGKGRRLPGLLVAVLQLALLIGGAALLSFFPRFVLGSILIYIGLGAALRMDHPGLVSAITA